MSQTVYLNGAYLPLEEARISPEDRGFLFGDGIYEVVRAYGGAFFELDAHLERMRRGLAALRIGGVDVPGLATVAGSLLERNGLAGSDVLVYMQVTRGAARRGHAFPQPQPAPTVYAAPTEFRPKADPAHGVAVVTAADQRWTRCDIKTTGLLANCMALQDAVEADATEALLVRDGVVLEGTHTSFFGVFEGVVRTAPASNYILPSITRRVALELCEEHRIPSLEAPIFAHELGAADELFLAGTTMEIMPIVQVDGGPVGDGRPGPVAGRLLELFHSRTPGAV
jgi:D-alanine transaminase